MGVAVWVLTFAIFFTIIRYLRATSWSSLFAMQAPRQPKIYHIVNIDRLHSIIVDGYLWCDAEINRRKSPGTIIGMHKIKERRLKLPLVSRPGLFVGDCVPFYFCPRSVMLYLIYRKNPELTYQSGQGPIIHLESDLQKAVSWAERNKKRWAFTLSNAGSSYFEDRCELTQLGDIDWNAVGATYWEPQQIKERKQAEFLLEHQFPWELVSRIGVYSQSTYAQATAVVSSAAYRPSIHIMPEWYY